MKFVQVLQQTVVTLTWETHCVVYEVETKLFNIILMNFGLQIYNPCSRRGVVRWRKNKWAVCLHFALQTGRFAMGFSVKFVYVLFSPHRDLINVYVFVPVWT